MSKKIEISNISKHLSLPLVLMSLSYSTVAAQLEEVVVTAQKREQNIQDVAISISAITEQGLERSGVSTTDDLTIVVPGLNVTRQLSSFAPILRGIGNYIAAPGAEGAIATYVDGIYIPSAYGAVMSLSNIDRIEVLRGPQGTLFGRNATGGLIHVITKEPEHEFGGKLGVSYGSQETLEAKAYVTGSISEKIAMDLGIFYRDQNDGFGKNLITGSDTVYRDELAIKSKMVIDATENTKITLMTDYADSETDSGLNRVAYKGTVNLFGESSPKNYHDLATARDHISRNETWGVAGRIESTISGLDFLTSISYRESDAKFSTEQSEASVSFIDIRLPTKSDSFTAEFQVKSEDNERIQWISGLYYLKDKAGVYPFYITGPGVPFDSNAITNEQKTDSWSIFGEVNLALTASTSLTVGARYTEDRRDYSSQTTILPTPPFPGALPTYKDSAKWTEPSWRVSLDHKLTDNFLVYGSYSRGFKSGLFNLFGGPIPAVDPEILDAYEIGFKSELFDGRVRLNAAAYYYEYDDLQLEYQVEGAAVLVNAANAEIKGVDIELLAALTSHIQLSANLAWNDSEFVDFPGAEITVRRGDGDCPITNSTPNCSYSTGTNAAGNRLPRAPKWTANLSLSYERDFHTFAFGAYSTYYYNDGFYNEFSNRKNYRQSSYNLINGGAYVDLGPSREWRVSLYFKNLTDEDYFTYGTATALGDYISPAFGRQYGFGLEYNF